MAVFELPIRVYIEDTDAGGIVYYANYLKFMERARTEFFRNIGVDKPAVMDDVMLVVHSVTINYRRAARLDDELLVSAELIKLGRFNGSFAQKVTRNGELLCDAEVKVACVDGRTLQLTAVSDDVHQRLSATMSAQPQSA